MSETYPVSYYCPHCGAVLSLARDGYLADKSVTPYPLEGWSYVAPDDPFEDEDGVRFVCGESEADGLEWTGERSPADDVEDPTRDVGCGEAFYLSFVRFEEGREVEGRPTSEYVTIGGSGPRTPRGPDGPGGFWE